MGLASSGGGGQPWPTVVRSLTLNGVYVGSRTMFEEMNRALTLHEVHPIIDRVFEFDDAVDAYRYLESQAHFGKVVIRV